MDAMAAWNSKEIALSLSLSPRVFPILFVWMTDADLDLEQLILPPFQDDPAQPVISESGEGTVVMETDKDSVSPVFQETAAVSEPSSPRQLSYAVPQHPVPVNVDSLSSLEVWDTEKQVEEDMLGK